MTERGPAGPSTIREQREQTIARLCDHFAQDRLTLEELERRLDVAERSQDAAELAALLQDLQPKAVMPQQPATPQRPYATPAPAPTQRAPLPVRRGTNSAIVALLGGAERRGHWRPAEHNFVLTVMGGAALDFREVQLPPGETEIFVLSFMGGAQIIVPPELEVDANGLAIMGAFDHYATEPAADPNAPRLKVHGVALMGGVEVHVRLPGETEKEARARGREARHEARQRRRDWR